MANNDIVPQIYVPSLSVPQISIPQINVPQINTPNAPILKTQPQPNRHVVDLGDIILGNPISGTKQLRKTLEDNGFHDLVYVPILNRIVGAGLSMDERFWHPIIKGKPGVALINSLETFGNSLDILANPVKSLLPWAGGGSSADFAKSMGWIENEYREIYQFDTGNIITDIIGEVLADPSNWFTLGGKQALSISNDFIIGVVKKAAKNLGYDITDDVASVITRKMADTISDSSDDTVSSIITKLEVDKNYYNTLLADTTTKQAKRIAAEANLRATELVANPDTIKNIYDSVVTSKWYSVYNKAKSAIKLGDDIDTAVLKASLGFTPTTAVGYLTYQYAVEPTFKYFWNKYVLDLQKGNLEKILNNRANDLRVTRKRIIRESQKMNEKTWKPFEKILMDYKITGEDLINMYKQLIDRYAKAGYNRAKLDAIFYDLLIEKIPILKEGASEVTTAEVKNLIRILGRDAIVLSNRENMVTIAFIKRLNEDINRFYSAGKPKFKPKKFKQYSVLERLNYLDKQYLTIDGKHYGLRKLDKYVRDMNKKHPEALAQTTALLNYLGITVNNSREVYNLLKAENIEGLENAMRLAKAGMQDSKSIKQDQRQLTKAIKHVKPKTPIKFNSTDSDILKFFEDQSLIKYKPAKGVFDELATSKKDIASLKESISEILYLDLGEHYDIFQLNTLAARFSLDVDSNFTTSEILNNILSFDVDKATMDDVKIFKENILELQARTFIWRRDILEDKVKNVDPTLKQIVSDLYGLLHSSKINNDIIQINDLLNVDEEVFRLTVSALGRHSIIDLELQDPFIANTIVKLSNVSEGSLARTNLQQIMNTLKDTQYASDAKYIGEILTRIDAHNAVNRLLNTAVVAEDLPTAVSNYIVGMFFNIIYYYKNTNINNINTERLTKFFMKRFLPDNEDKMIDYFVNKTVIDTSLQDELYSLQNKLNLNGLTDLEYARYDELKMLNESELVREINIDPKLAYEDFIVDLEVGVKKAFDNYVTQLNTIGSINGTLPTMYQQLDGQSIVYMTNLGLDKEAILDKLTELDVNELSIKSTEAFINFLVGGDMDPELLKYSKDALDSYYLYADHDKVYKQIVDVLTEHETSDRVLIEESLSSHLQQAYRNIDLLQTQLGGKKDILGRRWVSKDDSRIIKAYTNYVESSKVAAYIQEKSEWDNVYAWSTANMFLSFDRDIPLNFTKEHLLTTDYITYKEPGGAIKLHEFFKQELYKIKDLPYRNEHMIKEMRNILADVYKDVTLSIRPTDPEAYFKGYLNVLGEWVQPLSDTDILVWSSVTRKEGFNKHVALNYKKRLENLRLHSTSFAERADYYSDPSAVLNDLSAIAESDLISDFNKYEEFYEEAPIEYYNALYETIDKDFKTRLKDVTSLEKYEHVFSNHISNSVDWFNNTRVLDEIRTDERLVADVIQDKDMRVTLQRYGIDLKKSKMNSPETLRYLYIERTNWFNYSMSKWNAKQLRSWLDHNTDGMFIYVDDIGDYILRYTDEELAEAGLVRTTLSDNVHMHVIRRTDNQMTNTPYKYYATKSIFPEQQKLITDLLSKNRNAFNWEGMDVPDNLFTGQLMDNTAYEVIRKHDSISKALGKPSEQKVYSKMDKSGRNSFHTKNDSRPNFTIIGSPLAFNKVIDLCKEDLTTHNVNYFTKSSDILTSVWNGNLESIHRGNAINKYAQLFFNDDYYIGNEIFKPILTNASDKELEKLFSMNNYKAVVLKQTNKNKLRAYKIMINSKKDLQNAIDAGAILVPHEVYRNMVLTINRDRIDSKLINMYRRTIVGTFKSIYLNTIGFLMRNWLDSAVYKNNASYLGVNGMMNMFKYEYKAMKMLEWHDKIQRQVFTLADGKTFNRKNLRKVLANLSESERKTYLVIDMFVNSSASGGLSKSFDEFLLKRNQETTEFVGYAWEKWYHKNILDSPIFSKVRDINSLIEQSSRFGLFLAMLEETGDYSKAIRNVINTHFDYSLKEPGIELLEQFFWFSTFPINNFMYYINYGMVENPSMLKVQMDLLEQSYNDAGSYTWEDVRNSSYLSYNAMSGNIRFYLSDDINNPASRLVLKTGSSVLDFFSLICDPLGQAKDRLNPFISVLLGYEDVDQLSPLTSVLNRGKQIIKGQSYMPSVYTILYPKQNYKNLLRFRNTPNKYSGWTTPKKVYPKFKKVYFKKQYPQYVKRTYMSLTSVGYKWMRSTRGKKSYFYDNNARVIRAAGKFRRAMKKAKMPTYSYTKKETRY